MLVRSMLHHPPRLVFGSNSQHTNIVRLLLFCCVCVCDLCVWLLFLASNRKYEGIHFGTVQPRAFHLRSWELAAKCDFEVIHMKVCFILLQKTSLSFFCSGEREREHTYFTFIVMVVGTKTCLLVLIGIYQEL
jgi:hypothetical protein